MGQHTEWRVGLWATREVRGGDRSMVERAFTYVGACLIAVAVAHALAYQLRSIHEATQARYRAAIEVATGVR